MKRLLLLAALATACGDTTLFDPMERQPKFKPFAANPLYEDGRAMRQPPEGTVPRERQTLRPEITIGRDRAGCAGKRDWFQFVIRSRGIERRRDVDVGVPKGASEQ